jgi:hypothetical protein
MKTTILIALMLAMNGLSATVTDKMLSAIAMQESSNRNGIVGDKHLAKHSYGMYQIREAYLADVMKAYKKECIATFGRTLTLNDMQYSPTKAKWVVRKYIEHYGKAYEKRTGNKLTAEIAFRIHNGGPSGYRKDYKAIYAKTTVYSKLAMRYYGKV